MDLNEYNILDQSIESLEKDKYLQPSSSKIKNTLLADLSDGAILGYSKDGKNDSHFGFKNQSITIDSMDPNRPNAKNYTENTYRVLHWKSRE